MWLCPAGTVEKYINKCNIKLHKIGCLLLVAGECGTVNKIGRRAQNNRYAVATLSS